MCGILLHIGQEVIAPEHPALEIIRHRGPDGGGAMSFELEKFRVGLGHRRLAIIDLSDNGKQPMSRAEGRYWITFNGEIYNYLELREELAALGVECHTKSDTETLLAAYVQWGRRCLDKLNGMFAFVIYDAKDRKLFLARDHFGIKPLYYYNAPDGFTAVSEIKQLTQIPGFKGKTNREKLFYYLNYGDFLYDNECVWAGVYELPPGHFMELDLGTWKPGQAVQPRPWYEVSFDADYKGSFDDAVAEYLTKLKRAVTLQLRADVPLGFLLSGGLDSTTLVGVCAQLRPDRKDFLKTFSSCYQEKKFDEREYIESMLDYAAIDRSLHFPTPEETFDRLDNVIWSNELPIQPRSTVSQWLLYEHIKKDNDSRIVILEGQGADEVFCGYADFFWPYLYEQAKKGRLSRVVREALTIRRRYDYSWKVLYRKFLRTVFPERTKFSVNPAIRTGDLLPPGKSTDIPVRREASTVKETHRARMVILKYILHNVDRNSMAHSRETRVPFLDHELVEFAARLPSHYKLGDGWNKRLNREAAKDIVPEKVRWRGDKQGYSSPISVWAGGPLRDRFAAALEQAANSPFIEKDKVTRQFAEYNKGRGVFDPFWWRLIAADKWTRLFNIEA